MKAPEPGDWRAAAEAQGVSRLQLERTPGLLLAAHRLKLARQPVHSEAAYRALLKLEPGHRTALVDLINLLVSQGKYRAAVPLRRQLVELEVDRLGLPPDRR